MVVTPGERESGVGWCLWWWEEDDAAAVSVAAAAVVDRAVVGWDGGDEVDCELLDNCEVGEEMALEAIDRALAGVTLVEDVET